MYLFFRKLDWWLWASFCFIIYQFIIPLFYRIPLKAQLLYGFIEESKVDIFILGIHPYPLLIFKNSGMVAHDRIGSFPHIIMWPYTNENEFICTLAHEFGHVINYYETVLKLGYYPLNLTKDEVILRENTAWYHAHEVIKSIYGIDPKLKQKFDSMYADCMQTYFDAATAIEGE